MNEFFALDLIYSSVNKVFHLDFNNTIYFKYSETCIDNLIKLTGKYYLTNFTTSEHNTNFQTLMSIWSLPDASI